MRRVRRIVPAYYVQLVLLLLFFLPAIRGLQYVRDEAGFIAFNAVMHAAFLHYTTPLTSASLSLNGALWSLALEAQFYLLLPLLAPLFVRAPVRTGAAMLALAGLWRWLAMNDLAALVAWESSLGARWSVPEAAIRHLLFTQLPGYLGHFAVGMGAGCFWYWRGWQAPSRRQDAAGVALLAAAVALFAWAYGLGGGAVLGPVGSWLATLAALAALCVAVTGAGGLAPRVLVHRPVLFVGRVSYSIYLYHLPLLYFWNRFRIFDGSAASLPAFLACVLLVAWISYVAVEAPFLRRGQSRAPPIIAG
jgi:peptidoglycan/LPS O-acetylase OafA/YrhL